MPFDLPTLRLIDAGVGCWVGGTTSKGQGLEELLDKPIVDLTYGELVKVSHGLQEQLAQLSAS